MMIGPSGAGKSTFLEKNFFFLADPAYPRSALISSDALRQEMTGDFRDQSANDAVFNAYHLLVKARLDSGLNVIADSTHLYAKVRKSVRDLGSSNTDIHYWVIDRPLAEKHRTGGWRDEVVIDEIKLIDKHHQSFKSGLKHILAGDDDPRVTVHDCRSEL